MSLNKKETIFFENFFDLFPFKDFLALLLYSTYKHWYPVFDQEEHPLPSRHGIHIIWGNCIFPEKNLNIFTLKIFPGNLCNPDYPRPLYKANFFGTISSTFWTFWTISGWKTYFNFQYPKFKQNVSVKRNRVTKNCTSDLCILRLNECQKVPTCYVFD